MMKNKLLKSLCITVVLVTTLISSADIRVDGDACSIQADKNGMVTISDKDGAQLMKLKGIDLTWGPVRTDGGTASKVDDTTIKVDYKVIEDKTGKIRITGFFKCKADQVDASYTIKSPTPKLKVQGAMYIREPKKIDNNSTLYKQGRWVRHERGGVPYETHESYIRCFKGKNINLFEIITGNSNWSSKWGQHISFQSDGKGEFTADHSFLVLPKNTPEEAVAAMYKHRLISLTLVSSKDFNLWKSGKKPEFKIRMTNTSGKPLDNISYKLQVRNYDGKLIQNIQKKLSLKNREQMVMDLSWMPEPADEFYFIEASASVNGKETFVRTMASVMHDYNYKHGNDIFGIAAYFNIPSKTAVDKLLKRMGVKVVRKGDTRKTMEEFGAISYWHSNVKPGQWRNNPAKRQAWLISELKKCDERQNPYWEFCNEWNMRALNKGTGADVYVKDWLRPLAELKKTGQYKVKLLSMGLAAGDVAFLKMIHENGGWNLLDGIAFHPGRGNVTPDMANEKITWSYLAAIRKVKKMVAKLGNKPLWITEAYACTYPNSSWYDSYRRAAENIVLTYALGLAEGIQCVMFYQLQDSVWANKGAINPKDKEYHFGMLHRDGAVKPSLPAYCAIAEALDGAKFVRWLKFDNKYNKGLLFSRADGRQVAVLWNRRDGYFQVKDRKNYICPAPWKNHWKSTEACTIPGRNKEIVIVDSINRKRKIKINHEKAMIKLTGAPIIVYDTNF